MNKNDFIKELKKLNINISDEQLKKLEKYYLILQEENQHVNLTRITDKEEVYLKHFYDSLTLFKLVNLNITHSLCDVGTGAGFPGIVLKIIFPNLKVVLIDSLNKRIAFLNKVIKYLNLKNIEAIHCRMEDYSKVNKEKFDIITSRAVAKLEILTEISISSLKTGGHLVFMKGNCEDELKSLKKIINKYNSVIENVVYFSLPYENSSRTLVNIKKISKTSDKYPRSIEKIRKDYN